MKRRLLLKNICGLSIIPILVLGLAVTFMPTSAGTVQTVYSGFGSATVDGQLSAGEWDQAGAIGFMANTPEGTTTPAMLYVMNDENNLYLAVSVERPSLDSYTHLRVLFDNDNDGSGEHGDDFLVLYRQWTGTGFMDLFWSNIQNPPSLTFSDTNYGGSKEGTGSVDNIGGLTVLEMSHPLDSDDDEHDFSLAPGDSAGLTLTLYISNSSGNASTRLPISPQRFVNVQISGKEGFVTGGGWIWSFPGTYVPEPNVMGWANFGFVAKYHKGAEVPDGQAELVYHTAGMNFHSTEYEWLVVTGGNTAKFKGRGTINDEGDYKFMIWASDGEPDTFRIKIWEEVDGQEAVIYDNSLNHPAYENGQPIGSGQIVIHTLNKKPVEVLDQSQPNISYGFWFDNQVKRWQEFIPTGDNTSAVEVYLKRNGSPGNVITEIRTTEGVLLAQEIVPEEAIPCSGWVRIQFSKPVSLEPGNKYRLFIYSDQPTLSVENRYFWRGEQNSLYCPECDNDVKGSWPNYAYAFKTYKMTD